MNPGSGSGSDGNEASTGITVFEQRLGLVRPFNTSRGRLRFRRTLVVGITQGGVTGWGEAASLPGFGDETPGAVVRAARRWVAELASGIWTRPPSVALGGAVDGALVDLVARSAGVRPASVLSPGWVHDPVAVNALVTDPRPAGVAEEVSRRIGEGHRGVKLKVAFVEPELDVARIDAALGAAAGVPLRLDANRGWDHDTALRVLGAVSAPVVVEEPTPDPSVSAEVCRSSGAGLALDESWIPGSGSESVALALTRRGLVDTAVLKPSALGGPLRTLNLARSLERAGVTVVISSLLEGPVGLATAVHLAAATGPGPHGLATATLFDTGFPAWLVPRAGYITPPADSGPGVTPPTGGVPLVDVHVDAVPPLPAPA